MDGGGGADSVAGGEEVEEGAAQDGENRCAFGRSGRAAGSAWGLVGGEHGKPIPDSLARKVGPRAFRLDQGAGIALEPQRDQWAMIFGAEPLPHQGGHVGEVGPSAHSRAGKEIQLVGAGAGQQRADEAILTGEQVQQDPGAGADRGGQRAQRQFRQTVVEDIAVGELQ